MINCSSIRETALSMSKNVNNNSETREIAKLIADLTLVCDELEARIRHTAGEADRAIREANKR